MANVGTMFDSDSPYLKASDNDGMNRQMVIKAAGLDTLNFPDQPPKEGIFIDVGASKPIWLSKTNGRMLCGAFGLETDEWVGKKILLTVKHYDIEGKKSIGWITTPMVETANGADFDDDIPF